jgi:Domain of unknown function (DUF4129)
MWMVVSLSLVVALAALLRMAGPVAGDLDELKGMIRLPWPVTRAILTLFALAALVFALGVARRLFSRRGQGEEELLRAPEPMPVWLRTLTQVLSLANLVLVAYLIWRGVIPLTELLAFGRGAVSAIGASTPDTSVAAPALLTWTFGILAVVAALAAVALALWIAFGDRLVDWWMRRDETPAVARPPLGGEPLDDPRQESDPRRAIMRCYASFERVAARAGVARQPWHTPMEFMREALRRLPAARVAVTVLTSLFELARFSEKPLGAAERGRALAALDEVAGARTERRADAAS